MEGKWSWVKAGVLLGLLNIVIFFLLKFNIGEVMLGDYLRINTLALAAIYAFAIGVIVMAVDKIEENLKLKAVSNGNKTSTSGSTVAK